MELHDKPKGNIRVYACGGAGVNIGGKLSKYVGVDNPGFGNLSVVYVDTSKSNVREHVQHENSYILHELDGSGKVRSENHEEISAHIRAILQDFKPADLNIVISSAAGGSGSVIGPLITSELLATESPVIVITIGSTDTRLDTENTLKTLKSYEAIARLKKAPVVMSYGQNSNTTPRAKIDDNVVKEVTSLCILFSRQNHELDSKDLFNWLRFDKVTSYPAQLVAMSLVENTNELKDVGNVISVATLAIEDAATTLSNMPEYQCVGYLPSDVSEEIQLISPLHFVTSDNLFNEHIALLNRILKDAEQAQQARVRKQTILSDKDIPQNNGIVL